MNRGSIYDRIAALTITLGAPVFRMIGTKPGVFPRYIRQADKLGVHFRTTHYYDPVYAESDLPADTTGERELPGIDFHANDQLALLGEFTFQDELLQFADDYPQGLKFGHKNEYFDYCDAESLYCMLRHFKPQRLIEIGSGFSTMVASAALGRNAKDGAQCRHICIEPYERDWIAGLGVEVIRERVQDVDPELFATLRSGDFLFIDSTHVIRPFGDVLTEYQRIIPSLPSGVMIHVHDIFTPHDYPEEWLRQDRRLWNEQYLLEAMLAHSSRYRVRLALNWLKHHHGDDLGRAFPTLIRHPEHEPRSFWFEISR